MYLLVAAVAYAVAQCAKMIGFYVKDRKRAQKEGFWRLFTESGGMPSGHSATVSALAVYVGLIDGLYSATFGIAAILAIIVMYDAQKVRRATGENGLAIAKLLEGLPGHKKPYFARGHKPREVVVGAIIGVAVALIFWPFAG
jgi:acid phosphatase family membrane protein YuiD